MSYDLHIFGKRQPRAADLAAFVDSARALDVNGVWNRGSSLLLSDEAGIHVEVDGPARIETEDLPAAASGAIGKAGWMLAFSVKPASDETWPLELAKHMARSCDGVVYDPQQDVVTWPKGWRPRAPGTRDQVSDVVTFSWYMPHPEHPARPRQLMQLLRAYCPEAMPRRYGDYEPLQHRHEGDDDAFADFWTEQASDSIGFFFWTAERPCLGATVIMTPPKGPDDPRAQACTQLIMRFDARPFHRDPQYLRRMTGLFCEVAAGMQCFYAGAFLSRNAGTGGVPVVLEEPPFPFGSEWVGLPASPTWLAWFGTPYAEAVRTAVRGHVTLESESGLFLSFGDEPLNADELGTLFPRLPGRLLARRGKGRGRWLTGVRYSMGRGPPSRVAADVLPLTR